MKFIIMRMADAATEAGVMPGEELLQAMGDYNQALTDAGLMVDGMGLMPTSKGARIRFKAGVPTVTDGPFTESKELLAGFTLIKARSKQEALDWVRRWPALDGDGEAELQLRQVFEMEDFMPGDGLATHQGVADQLQKQPSSLCMYLSFNGNCEEAFNFYAEQLGGRILMLARHRDAPAEAKSFMPVGMDEQVMHACVQIGPYQIMGTDAPASRYQPPSGVHLQITVDDMAQAENTFAALSAGGTVQMPLTETFWARAFGIVTDRFGIPWMINSGYKTF